MVIAFLKSKIFIALISVALIFSGVYYWVFIYSLNNYEIVKAEIGTIKREIYETASIKGGDIIKLSFKEGGRINNISVSVGDQISPGRVLARIDDANLRRELEESKAILSVATSSFNNATLELQDILRKSESSLNAKYEEVLSLLGKSRIDARNAFDVAEEMRSKYFNIGIYPSNEAEKARNEISTAYQQFNNIVSGISLEGLKLSDGLIIESANSLKKIYEMFEIMIEAGEHNLFKDDILPSDKEKMKSSESIIKTRHTEIVLVHQEIINLKVINKAGENTVEGKINSSLGEIERARARVLINEERVADSEIKSPYSGTVVEIVKRVGEIAGPGDAVILFLSDDGFKVESDIYEGDISRISVGDEVEIKLVAFPDRTFRGNIEFIDPIEKIINDVVYYKISINTEGFPEGIKPSMTADIKIITDKREEVIVLPLRTIKRDGDRNFVIVQQGSEIIEKDIKLGLIGDDRMVEVLSGISVGEEIIVNYP